ncbi:MAG: NAD(P)/FAD-dependent oxidoreductase [Defluviitaleaceae bacterium]|nr:NAD(P)/FAD-dependent oxidoreductase [Defluviitaleaceae bacterium]
MSNRLIVIGGGPAGMIAAGTAARLGYDTELLEKNDKLGRKLYLTGKGRCNVTNAADPQDVIERKIIANPSFMYSSLYTFDSFRLTELLAEHGAQTVTERGGRVFPASGKASDVTRALERYLAAGGVRVRLGSQVSKISVEDGSVSGVVVSGGLIETRRVIVATGGLSYPATGSTGDGYRFAKSLGHSVTKLHPALCSMHVRENFVAELEGLSLRNVGIVVRVGGKTLYKDFGEMLFTDRGVSGPLILSAQRRLIGRFADSPELSIDLKPALDELTLEQRILDDFERHNNRSFKNSLDELLPRKLIPIIVRRSAVSPEKPVNAVTKGERRNLVRLLKDFTLEITGSGGFDEAVVTSGGVSVSEINPSTMQSKIVKGLYFAGEVLDVDALTGGYNLQIAFSTGYLAGLQLEG